MAVDERIVQTLSPVLEADEKVLYTGPCVTNYTFFSLYLLAISPLLWLLLRTKSPAPRSWHLAISDRRLILCPLNFFGRPSLKHPGEEQSYRYQEVERAELDKWFMTWIVLRLWTTQGKRVEIKLASRRNNRADLEATLRQAAPRLLVS